LETSKQPTKQVSDLIVWHVLHSSIRELGTTGKKRKKSGGPWTVGKIWARAVGRKRPPASRLIDRSIDRSICRSRVWVDCIALSTASNQGSTVGESS
jgi:hypothetical protein